jgi:hypothetical protein
MGLSLNSLGAGRVCLESDLEDAWRADGPCADKAGEMDRKNSSKFHAIHYDGNQKPMNGVGNLVARFGSVAVLYQVLLLRPESKAQSAGYTTADASNGLRTSSSFH